MKDSDKPNTVPTSEQENPTFGKPLAPSCYSSFTLNLHPFTEVIHPVDYLPNIWLLSPLVALQLLMVMVVVGPSCSEGIIVSMAIDQYWVSKRERLMAATIWP